LDLKCTPDKKPGGIDPPEPARTALAGGAKALPMGLEKFLNECAAAQNRPVAEIPYPAAERIGKFELAALGQNRLDLFPAEAAPTPFSVVSRFPSLA
jgi:hypothetical protein